jgi:hypothetical protein
MMASGNFVIQAEFWSFCIDSWKLSSLTPIASLHVFGCGEKVSWKVLLLDIGQGALVSTIAIFWALTFILSTFDDGLFPVAIYALDPLLDI